MWTYKGLSAAIVTAADEAFAHLLFDLCDSLKAWQRYLHVIDIGLSDATLKELARRKIKVAIPPSGFFGRAKLRANYIKALYLRPSLPDLFPADIIMWIDADCWIQRQEAISTYFDCAIEFPDKFTLCALLDIDYTRCIEDYLAYQQGYRKQYEALFGAELAEFLFCKAILSAGVFAGRPTSSVWGEWRSAVAGIYDRGLAFEDADLAHMAEQLSLNVVLHRTRKYHILNAEMNWHCHCSNVVREGELVRIMPSERVPAIVHLADLKSAHRAEHYRNNRLFYERPSEARPKPDFLPSAESLPGAGSAASAKLRVCVYTCLIGTTEVLNEQPFASSEIPFICFTDNPDRRSETWQLRLVTPLFEMDSVRSQRVLKILCHKYLPDFDVSLYIDNGVLLKQTPEEFITTYFPEFGLGVPEHSFRDDVLDEFLVVANDGLDDPSRIFEQLNHYAVTDPDSLEEKPYWTGILLRDHRNPSVPDLLDVWWAHVQRYSRRDQLSLNYVLRRCGVTPNAFALDNHNSSFHSWPHKTPARQPARMHRPVATYGTLSARIRELENMLAAVKGGSERQIAELQEANQRLAPRIRELEWALEQEKQRQQSPTEELAQEEERIDDRPSQNS
ncbi:MAG: DUF616 domain-containing protein [Methylobacteriaceae bacterium]|nr:DUF616 domain-containing protein [Methylobacteriaceae bacterium]